jgi:hypothetical protein
VSNDVEQHKKRLAWNYVYSFVHVFYLNGEIEKPLYEYLEANLLELKPPNAD